MALIQIVMIWGALSGALFPSLSSANEQDDYQQLKDAMVRSKARVDRQLPPWIGSLDVKRGPAWYILQGKPEPSDNSDVEVLSIPRDQLQPSKLPTKG